MDSEVTEELKSYKLGRNSRRKCDPQKSENDRPPESTREKVAEDRNLEGFELRYNTEVLSPDP